MRISLFWRVFLVNAALLIAGVLVLALTPITVSAKIRTIQAIVLAAGVFIVLVANLLLLRPLFAPLERLAHRMEELDVLRTARPIPASSPGEIGALERTFNRMIERLETERRQAGARALRAREEERQRIARGLHDEVGQTMTGILFLLKQLAEQSPPTQQAPLEEAQQAVRTNLEEVRRIAQELRPEVLDHLGLASAVNNLARAFARRTNIAVERHIDPKLGQLEPNTELVLYRVAPGKPDQHRAPQQCRAGSARPQAQRQQRRPADRRRRPRIRATPSRRRRLARHPRKRPHRRRRARAQAKPHRRRRGTPRSAKPDRRLMPIPPVTRILIADDHALVRQGVRRVLDNEADLTVAAEAADGAEAVERALDDSIDLAILDISMPRKTGLQAAHELSRRRPELRTLILSMYENEQFLFEALRAGASGYVLKSGADNDIVDACRAAMRGQSFLYPSAVHTLIRDFIERADERGRDFDLLTPRELEVLKLIAEGHTSKEIAAMLVISIKTVDRHRTNMLEKLGMRDRVELTRYAIRRGLIEA